MSAFNLAFMGTPDFAVPALEGLIDAGHNVCVVYTQPPRPAGRGKAMRPSPVHQLADQCDIPVRTPASLKSPEEKTFFETLALDAAVVAAYGLILPPAFLVHPRLGCLNIHASLLPRWRGAAPIQRAIMAGDTETGITIMQMEEGLDTGPIVLRAAVPITPHTTAGTLHDELAVLGAKLITRALDGLNEGTLKATPQPQTGITYAAKIDKAESRIDWSRPAVELDRLIRALSPFPGAWFEANTTDGPQRVKVLRALPVEASGPAGRVLASDLTIACGKGALRLVELQRAGRKAMTAEDFLRGFPLPPGTQLS